MREARGEAPERREAILVVEDEAVVALDIALQIEEAGFRCLGPVGTPADAHGILELEQVDFAVLDANLNSQTPKSVAEELVRRQIPFVYVSGYDKEFVRRHLPDAALFQKPVRIDEVLDEVREVLAAKAG